jgi:thiamine biosynthesis lipoprotein
MGTRFELLIHDEAPDRFRAAAEAAIEEIDVCHRRLTRFEANGLIGHLRRSGAAVPLDSDTWALFQDAVSVWRDSGGAFDLTAPAGHMESILLDPTTRTIRLADRALPLDFGAIAKGHALDLAARVLRDAGVTSAFLHGGTSSAFGLGSPPESPGWDVALGPEAGAPVITLCNTALSVSAVWPGNPHPTIDPRSATLVQGPRRVAVVGPSARLADAWSTAVLVLGQRPPALGPEWQVVIPRFPSLGH